MQHWHYLFSLLNKLTFINLLYYFFFFRNVADELRIFESINHPHLINHFGVEIHREEMLIFMEYCPEGTLESLCLGTENGLEESM